MVKMNNAQSALKPISEPWDISTWKKTNWRISILRKI